MESGNSDEISFALGSLATLMTTETSTNFDVSLVPGLIDRLCSGLLSFVTEAKQLNRDSYWRYDPQLTAEKECFWLIDVSKKRPGQLKVFGY